MRGLKSKLSVNWNALGGVDISAQRSETNEEAILREATFIVTLCGDAKDQCPVIFNNVQYEHWSFPDPAKATGTGKEIIDTFRTVRNAIGAKIKRLANIKDGVI